MHQISIDIETYSSTNLAKTGVYPYAASDDFELLLFGYAIDFGPVNVVDLTQGEQIPTEILHALDNPTIIKRTVRASLLVTLRGPSIRANWLALFARLGGYFRTTTFA